MCGAADDEIWFTVGQSDQKLNLFMGGTSVPGYHHSSTQVLKDLPRVIGFAYNNSSIVLYLDGQQDGGGDTTGSVTINGAFRIGTSPNVTDGFTGLISRFRIFMRI